MIEIIDPPPREHPGLRETMAAKHTNEGIGSVPNGLDCPACGAAMVDPLPRWTWNTPAGRTKSIQCPSCGYYAHRTCELVRISSAEVTDQVMLSASVEELWRLLDRALNIISADFPAVVYDIEKRRQALGWRSDKDNGLYIEEWR